jgi:hypothetical protein
MIEVCLDLNFHLSTFIINSLFYFQTIRDILCLGCLRYGPVYVNTGPVTPNT